MNAGSIYFAPIGCGLGDLIVSIPILNWLTGNSNRPVLLVERGPRQQDLWTRIPGLAGAVPEPDLQLGSADTYINMREHDLSRNYDWGSERFLSRYPGWNIDDIHTAICSDFGLKADFQKLQPLSFLPSARTEGKVLLVPGTTGDYKTWPAEMWIELHQQISSKGFASLVLGEPEHSQVVRTLLEEGLPHLPTITIGEAIDAVSSSLAVVAVDTGLQHLAVQQGRPTVAAVNWLHTYLRRQEHCYPVISPICQPECMIPHPETPNNPAVFGADNWKLCDYMPCRVPERHCMSQITCGSVLDALISALEHNRTNKPLSV